MATREQAGNRLRPGTTVGFTERSEALVTLWVSKLLSPLPLPNPPSPPPPPPPHYSLCPLPLSEPVGDPEQIERVGMGGPLCRPRGSAWRGFCTDPVRDSVQTERVSESPRTARHWARKLVSPSLPLPASRSGPRQSVSRCLSLTPPLLGLALLALLARMRHIPPCLPLSPDRGRRIRRR